MYLASTTSASVTPGGRGEERNAFFARFSNASKLRSVLRVRSVFEFRNEMKFSERAEFELDFGLRGKSRYFPFYPNLQSHFRISEFRRISQSRRVRQPLRKNLRMRLSRAKDKKEERNASSAGFRNASKLRSARKF